MFEKLDVNLFELLKRNAFRGLSLSLVQVWRVTSVPTLPGCSCCAPCLLAASCQGRPPAGPPACLPTRPRCPPLAPQMFLRQLLDSLAVLRDAGIIHCDLKPENILLMNPQVGGARVAAAWGGQACSTQQGAGQLAVLCCAPSPWLTPHRVRALQSGAIKLIDFGSACFENRTVYSYIQSRSVGAAAWPPSASHMCTALQCMCLLDMRTLALSA